MKSLKSCLAVLAALFVLGACTPTDDSPAKLSLSQTTAYDFPSETGSDYAPITPLNVTVKNTGGTATGKVNISVDGASGSSFTLSKTSIDNIAAGGSDSFTVVPKQGLAIGDYQATVRVSARGLTEQSFAVRFVITDVNVVSIEIKSQPTKTVYAVGEPLDLTGLVVEATDDEDNKFNLEDIEKYLLHDEFSEFEDEDRFFLFSGDKTVQIAVGAAPVKELNLTVKSLRERIAAAAGKTETIIIYGDETVLQIDNGDETFTRTIGISTANTDVTLTTPEGSTKERLIKRDFGTTLFSINGTGGGIKFTLDGYVTLKGLAKSDYGGSDELNATNPLITMTNGAVLEMKGHSKITGNVVVKTASGTYTDGSAIKISTGAQCTIGGNAQLTKNGFVQMNGGNVYGGAIWVSSATDTNRSVLRIKDNAKITENFIQSKDASLGGAFGGEVYSLIYMEGGEVSGNYVKSTEGQANGGAICLINGSVKSYFSGGVIKDNYIILQAGKTYRGSGIVVNNSNMTLSGSISIPGGPVVATDEGSLKKDASNSISIGTTGTASCNVLIIDGALSTTSKMILDIFVDTNSFSPLANLDADLKLMRKTAIVDEAPAIVDFSGDAPASLFQMRNYINYRGGAITDISAKTINSNGFMTTPAP